MDPETARFVISEIGREALRKLSAQPDQLSPGQEISTLQKLRRNFLPEEAAALFEAAASRQRAERQHKFSRASEMFFTRSGLEQSSGENVSSYRAKRMADVLDPGTKVADLGCGIGGDSLAFAAYLNVTGVDLDEARLVFARANTEVYGRASNFKPLQKDLTRIEPAELKQAGIQAIFFDPARRSAEGKRFFSVEQYQPPLSTVNLWRQQISEIGVKISPGVDYSQLIDYNCEIEIISDGGEVKEAVLWFGGFRTEGVERRATLLPGGDTITSSQLNKRGAVPCGPPRAYLYEPDGAVIRAGLVEELALQLGSLHKLDPDIAFLTGDNLIKTGFARSFKIMESYPFNLKKLSRRLHEMNVGRVTIKKRGSPLDPQQLEHALKLKGENSLILVLTHVEGKPFTLLCEE